MVDLTGIQLQVERTFAGIHPGNPARIRTDVADYMHTFEGNLRATGDPIRAVHMTSRMLLEPMEARLLCIRLDAAHAL